MSLASIQSYQRYLGERYGRLVIQDIFNEKGRILAYCLCDCGKKKKILIWSLRRGKTKSCGCLQRERAKRIGFKSLLPKGEAPLNILFAYYKKAAKKRDIPFAISRDDFKNLVNGNCYYCDEKPSMEIFSRYKNDRIKYNGVDRVNNTLGYIIGNCVSCCEFCNKAKRDLSLIDFFSKVSRIYNFSEIKKYATSNNRTSC